MDVPAAFWVNAETPSGRVFSSGFFSAPQIEAYRKEFLGTIIVTPRASPQ